MKRLLVAAVLVITATACHAQVAPQYALAPGQAAHPDSYRIYVEVYDVDTRTRLDGYSERFAFSTLKARNAQITKHLPHLRDATHQTDRLITPLMSTSYTNGYEQYPQVRRIITSQFCTQITADDEPRDGSVTPRYEDALRYFQHGMVNSTGLDTRAAPR